MSTRVLLVDDEPLLVTGLRVSLEDEGLQVESAESGEGAMNIVRDDCGYDVCIIDMRLAGVTRDNRVRALHGVRPELKFNIHAGLTDCSIPDDLPEMGIVEKPFVAEPLLDAKVLADSVEALAGNRG